MLGTFLRSLLTPSTAPRGFALFIADVDTPREVRRDSSLYSSQAAFRLRTLVAARSAAETLPVWLVPPDFAARPGALESLGKPRLLFMAKFISGRLLAEQELFGRLRQRLETDLRELPAVADITDDYDAMPAGGRDPGAMLGRWQAMLLERCHVAVTCEALREALLPRARHGVSVIEDPYECAGMSAWRAPAADPLRICWFGNTAAETLAPLEQALRAILERFPDRACAIELVTAGRWPLVRELAARLSTARSGIEFTFTEWSLEATWAALERCDFVLLPHDCASDWVRAKSHNRLVAAIAAGRLALGSPIPSYRELAEGAWINDDLPAGIAWALERPEEARACVRRGQALIERRFAPATVGGKWARALGLEAPARIGAAA